MPVTSDEGLKPPNGPRIRRDKKTATLLLAVFLWFTLTVLLLDIQRIFGKDNAGIIGVEMVSGEEGHAAEVNAHVAFAYAVARCANRYGRDGLNPDIQVFEIVHLTHGTVHPMPSHSFWTAIPASSASINARRTEPPPSTTSTRPRPFCSSRSYNNPLSSKHFTVMICPPNDDRPPKLENSGSTTLTSSW